MRSGAPSGPGRKKRQKRPPDKARAPRRRLRPLEGGAFAVDAPLGDVRARPAPSDADVPSAGGRARRTSAARPSCAVTSTRNSTSTCAPPILRRRPPPRGARPDPPQARERAGGGAVQAGSIPAPLRAAVLEACMGAAIRARVRGRPHDQQLQHARPLRPESPTPRGTSGPRTDARGRRRPPRSPSPRNEPGGGVRGRRGGVPRGGGELPADARAGGRRGEDRRAIRRVRSRRAMAPPGVKF